MNLKAPTADNSYERQVVEKSCGNCVNNISDQALVRVLIRRPISQPICAAHGLVLGVKNQSDADRENLYEAYAENCSFYGIEKGTLPISNPQLRVCEPSSDAIKSTPTVPQALDSCHACVNLVKHEAVFDKFGWAVPICRAKGTLITNAKEAVGCGFATPGVPSNSVDDLTLRRELRPGFIANPDKAFKALINNQNLHLEPTTYETDYEVTDEDKADGIRAWRKLIDPYGSGQEIPIPIFDPNFFSSDEQTMIPQTGSEHHPELYIDYGNLTWAFAVESWTLNNTLFIQSQPGLGKTEFGYFLGWLMQLPVTRIFFNDKTEWDDIFGKMILRNGEMVFQRGSLTHPAERPGIILIDEPNTAPQEIVGTLRTTTEHNRVIYLDAAIAEFDSEGKQTRKRIKVDVNPYNFILWAGNPAWDPRNLGTKELAAADISRLTPEVLDHPPAAIERHIIKSTVKTLDSWDIPDSLLDEILRISVDIREMSDNGEFPGTWGIRENVKVARKLRWYPLEKAYRMAGLNHFEPETREMVINTSIKTIRDDSAKPPHAEDTF